MVYHKEGKNMREDLLKIINTYGINKQLKYIHSEYYELDEAIFLYETDEETVIPRIEKLHKNNIAEEIADITVMLKQFQYYYDITDQKVKNIMKEKIERQLQRIESENVIQERNN